MSPRIRGSAPVCAVCVALLCLASALPGFADGDGPRFSTFGNVGVSTLSGWNGKSGSDAAATIAAGLYLEMNDRFSTDRAELYVHHSLTAAFLQPGPNSPPQDVPTPQLSVYEAYLRLFPASWLSLSVGRHRFTWGNGLLLSPTDSFQPTSFQGLTGEMPSTLQDSAAQTGFTGVGAQFFPSADLTASLGVSVDDALAAGVLTPQDVRLGGIVSFVAGPAECFLSGVYQARKTLRPGAGASLDVLGLILRAEAGLELDNHLDYPTSSGHGVSFGTDGGAPRPGVSAGIEKIFSKGDDTLSIFGEYLYLGWGYTRDQERILLSSLPSTAPAVPQPLGQHYANVLVAWSRADSWDLENLFMIDLTGPGVMGSNTVTYLGFTGFSLTAGVTWLAGGSRTEFGSSDNKVFGILKAQVDF